MDSTRLQSIQVPYSDTGIHFNALLDNQEGYDVIFYVSGKNFHAYRLDPRYFKLSFKIRISAIVFGCA